MRAKLAIFAQLTILTALVFVFWTPNAQAYIDPTAAGAALQSLYMLGVSALMFVALLPKKVAGFFMAIKQRFFGRPAAVSDTKQE
ncbi:MAG TPA: hypothetical protein V6D47_15330 [Oscillatoriaceae cyanobacterium]